MYSKPRFLQGIYDFEGQGLHMPFRLSPTLTYTVPAGVRAQLVYLRAGNATDELVTLILMRDGAPMRYFPIGARAGTHVALAVTEDLYTGTILETYLSAPAGFAGTVVIDLGLIEV